MLALSLSLSLPLFTHRVETHEYLCTSIFTHTYSFSSLHSACSTMNISDFNFFVHIICSVEHHRNFANSIVDAGMGGVWPPNAHAAASCNDDSSGVCEREYEGKWEGEKERMRDGVYVSVWPPNVRFVASCNDDSSGLCVCERETATDRDTVCVCVCVSVCVYVYTLTYHIYMYIYKYICLHV